MSNLKMMSNIYNVSQPLEVKLLKEILSRNSIAIETNEAREIVKEINLYNTVNAIEDINTSQGTHFISICFSQDAFEELGTEDFTIQKKVQWLELAAFIR